RTCTACRDRARRKRSTDGSRNCARPLERRGARSRRRDEAAVFFRRPWASGCASWWAYHDPVAVEPRVGKLRGEMKRGALLSVAGVAVLLLACGSSGDDSSTNDGGWGTDGGS